MDPAKDMIRRRLICLLLALVTVAVFWSVTGDHFVNFDDDVYVTHNPMVNRGLTPVGIVWAFTHFYAGNWHPLTWLSHMLDCQLFGLHAGAHHAVNLAFHTTNVVLLFLLLNRMTGALWRSALVAALFALHPLRVESVAWISERKDVLSAFFGLLALLAYVRFAREPTNGESRTDSRRPSGHSPFVIRHSGYWQALGWFACGLMSKPMLVTFPFVMLLLDFWPLNRVRSAEFGVRNFKGLLLEKIPFFALSAASCVVTFLAQKSGGAVASLAASPGLRLDNALVSYVRYLDKMVWPVNLAVLYPLSPIPAWQAADAGVILLGLTLLCAAAARRRPYLLTGWLWYLGMLVPVIGLIQIGPQAFADRYTYLPMVGLLVAVVWGAGDLTSGWKFQKAAAGVSAALVLSLCAADTVFQLQFWKNGVTLFAHTLAVTTDNPVAQNDYAAALSAAGQPQAALPHYAEAVKLDPNNALLQNNFGVALARAGRTNAALACYREAIRLQPDYADAYNNLGSTLTGQGHLAEAVSVLNRAQALQPDNADVCNNLGAALALQGKWKEAVASYRQAAQLAPRNATIRLNLGLALLRLGHLKEAAVELSDAARLNPRSPQAQYQWGRCLAMFGQPAAAITHLRLAARLRPNWPEPLDAQAWILATDGDPLVRNGAEAVRLAESAAALSQWRQPVILNTLAAAYAEAGRFGDATNTANRAIELAEQSGQSKLAAQIQSARDLYLHHRPFRHAEAP